MNSEERQEAVFGAFDGIVSIIGFIFGLLVHKSPESAIAIGGLGGAVAAGVSMGFGEYEKHDGDWRSSLPVALVMFAASLGGSLVAVWPFFVFSSGVALAISLIGCLAVATWIGYMKHKGWRGYATAFATFGVAAGITLLVVSLIPASA